jgi:hypothetical protein
MWQRIETAPKDGTLILMVQITPHAAVQFGAWGDDRMHAICARIGESPN